MYIDSNIVNSKCNNYIIILADRNLYLNLLAIQAVVENFNNDIHDIHYGVTKLFYYWSGCTFK